MIFDPTGMIADDILVRNPGQVVDFSVDFRFVVFRTQLDLFLRRQRAMFEYVSPLTDCVGSTVDLVTRFDNFTKATFALASQSRHQCKCDLLAHQEFDLFKILSVPRRSRSI